MNKKKRNRNSRKPQDWPKRSINKAVTLQTKQPANQQYSAKTGLHDRLIKRQRRPPPLENKQKKTVSESSRMINLKMGARAGRKHKQ